MEQRRKTLLRFALVFAAAATALAWPFPWTGRAFRAVLCPAVNAVIMNPQSAPDVARLLPDRAAGRDWHATAAVWNQPTQSLRFKMDVDFHQSTYLPLMLFLALTVAGAVCFGRKKFPIRHVALGLALLLSRSSLSFILLRRQADGLLHEGPLDVTLQIANLAIGAPLGMAYACPLILWLLLCRRALRPHRPTA